MTTTAPSLMTALMDHAVRADPYPLYARMRERPMSVEPDGTFVLARHAHVHALLRDPRVLSDMRSSDAGYPIPGGAQPSFLLLDPPDPRGLRPLTRSAPQTAIPQSEVVC